MTDVSPDFVGRVERLSLRSTADNALLPLFEAVSNSLHAVDDRFGKEVSTRSVIKVEVIRADFADEKSPVNGFIVEDNGIGLDRKNFESFRRLDSRHKKIRGGKGIGRLGWLKVFQNIEIDSCYTEDGNQHRRSFDFRLSESNQIVDHAPRSGCPVGGGTRVSMREFTPNFSGKCPVDPETILQKLAQHFLNALVAENPIVIQVIDGPLKHNLTDYVLEHVKMNNLDPLNIKPDPLDEDVEFLIRHLRISKKFRPTKGFNRLLMFGNDRSANERNIDSAIGLEMLDGEEIYIGCISSKYLDQHVNSERTGFTLSEDELTEIRRKIIPKVNEFLGDQVKEIKEQKRKRAQGIINDFPQFLFIRDEIESFIDGLKPSIKSTEDVFLEMARKRYRRQGTIRSLGEEITKKGSMSEKIEEAVSRYRSMIGEDQRGVLAEYVLRRKGVLDLFDSLQEWRDAATEKRHREAALHSLICPMGVDSADMEFEQHNLWMVDDRLAFFAYFNSDKRLSSYTDIDSAERPDIAFFYDTCFAWRGEGEASNTVVLVEFKIPGRDNYNGNDNPVRQVNEYVQKLRSGSLVSAKGRLPSPRLRDAAYHCYIIADITPSFEREITMLPFTETPDGEGLFGYIGNGERKIYVEIIPYSKLLRDAKLRQGIFFQKLGLTDFDRKAKMPEEEIEKLIPLAMEETESTE